MIRRLATILRYCSTVRNCKICNQNKINFCSTMKTNSENSSSSNNTSLNSPYEKYNFKILINNTLSIEFLKQDNKIFINFIDINTGVIIQLPVQLLESLLHNLVCMELYYKENK